MISFLAVAAVSPLHAALAAPKVCCRAISVVEGLSQPTAAKFVPNMKNWVLITQKSGELIAYNLTSKQRLTLHKWPVQVRSEQGLLGMDFSPDFTTSRKMYVSYSAASESPGSPSDSVIEQTTLTLKEDGPSGLVLGHQILRVAQPYPNHNGGEIAFGPDGFLYVGLGDGGGRDDPGSNGQNVATLLGSILRLDVNNSSKEKPYQIPRGNLTKGLPEIYAYGLRNPWRFSFLADGRLVVGDVGQDKWEEVNLVKAASNLGWPLREGKHCYLGKSRCQDKGLTDPVLEYGRSDGGSITGGYEYLGREIPELRGKYLFADFLSGKIWASDLKEKSPEKILILRPDALISSFARDENGEIYYLDFKNGNLSKLSPRA